MIFADLSNLNLKSCLCIFETVLALYQTWNNRENISRYWYLSDIFLKYLNVSQLPTLFNEFCSEIFKEYVFPAGFHLSKFLQKKGVTYKSSGS